MSASLLLLLFLAITPVLALCSAKALVPWAIVLMLLTAWRMKPNFVEPRTRLRSLLIFLGLLLLWPLITILWTITPLAAASVWLRVSLAMLTGAFLLLYLPKTIPTLTQPIEKINRIALLSFTVALGLAMWEGHTGNGPIAWVANLSRPIGKQFAVTDINRGICLLVLWVWPLCLLLSADRRRLAARMLPWFILPVIASLWSLSATVGLLAGIFSLELLRLWPQGGRWMLRLLLPLALLSWPWSFQLLGGTDQPGSFYDGLPPSSQHRVMIWHFAYEKAMEKPLFGWGMDSSRSIPGGTEYYAPYLAKLPLHPHNTTLQIFLEQGLIGLLLTTAAIMYLMRLWDRASYPSPEAKAYTGAAIVTYLVIGISGFGMWQYWWLTSAWLTGAALLCALAVSRREAAEISHG